MPQSLPELPRLVSLRRLFPQASFVGCGDVHTQDVTSDSRQASPDCVFAALSGSKLNGRDFVDDAVRRGARAILTTQPLAGVNVSQCIVRDCRAAYARLCDAVVGDPSSRLRMTGVTGTNGKTTTTWMLRSILSAAERQCGVVGTVEYHDGRVSRPASLTTPDARTMFRLLRSMVDAGSTHAAIELSSHSLDQQRVAGLPLAAAILTNVTQDHFDYHRNFDTYLTAKAKIIDYVAPGGVIVLNADDPGSERVLEPARASGHRVLTCSVGVDVSQTAADVCGQVVGESLDGTLFRLLSRHSDDAPVDVRLTLPGLHNVSNAVQAAAVAMHFGIPASVIADGLQSLPAVPGRLEPVAVGQEFHVFVDYAHTDDALRRVVQSLKSLTSGRLLCVFGAGGDRDQSKRPLLAQAASFADFAVVTSDNPRSEDPLSIIEDITSGFPHGYSTFHIECDRRRAIDFALSEARRGDCVLIAGKGHEAEQITGTDRLAFDDREVTRELIAQRELTRSQAAGH
jgi:UDP-N-acetylmuramoyl-L-alanyl-D-glutamate--2,6-diaminopimelate ligase